MSGITGARFEEAEKLKGQILLYVGVICFILAWLVRHSNVLLTLVSLVTVYLMTGDRYQWVYIWKKTVRRDFLGFRVVFKTISTITMWEHTNTTVVSRFGQLVRQQPDKPAFVMNHRSITYREGDDLSNRIAWSFKRRGFMQGDVVALFMETQPEYAFLWLGLAKLKVITALVNTSLRGGQLIHCLKIAGCKALIFGDELADAVKDIQSEVSEMPLFQYNSPERPSSEILQNTAPLAAELSTMPDELFEPVPSKPRDILLYIYTSGTTGFPKAAIILNVRYLLITLGAHTSARLTQNDVIYDPLPLHHTAGGVLGAGQALVMGCTVVLRKKFSASNYWSDASAHGCTCAQYIGEMCRYLLNTKPSPIDQSHGVKTILGNGLRPQIWEDFVKRFNIKKAVEFYGATEGNSNLINLDSKVGAIGFMCRLLTSIYPVTLVRCDEITGDILRGSNGLCIPCGPQETGLLLGKIDATKAMLTFAGYADKTASEKKMVRDVRAKGDCYFNTGDIMVMDHFGYLYFMDRTGDTFRWRGENVSTAEVEGVISTIVGLKDTIVYGVKVPNVEGKAGMVAIADPTMTVNLSQLAKGLKETLPAYARPLFVRVLPEPPLTATFKLKKKELIEQGFNPEKVSDPLFFLDPSTQEYILLTQNLHDDIVKGNVRL